MTSTTTSTKDDDDDSFIVHNLETQNVPSNNSDNDHHDDPQEGEEEEEVVERSVGHHHHHVLIYDTSLRDGTQGESVSVSCDDKLKIARRLAEFGVDYIEAGWPGSNPKDAAFFARSQQELSSAVTKKLVAFGSTRRKSVEAAEDGQIRALLESGAPTICIVAKAHKWQVTDILRATPDENLDMIYDSVQYLTNNGGSNGKDNGDDNDDDEQQQPPKSTSRTRRRNVMVDLEHFFDGYAHDADYAMKCCSTAMEAGATGLVLCDTNGGSMPWQVEQITRRVVEFVASQHSQGKYGENDVTVGIHAHNDCGMAVANSMVATHAGARLVQGTINGIGERTGNADLCSIVPSLALHDMDIIMDNEEDNEEDNKQDNMEENNKRKKKTTTTTIQMSCRDNLANITSLSRFVDETLNRSPNHAAPYVGSSAFAHKGGLHVAAMERSPLSYQHVDPTAVGNEKRILISELSGRQNIMGKIREASGTGFGEEGAAAANASERAMAVLERVKKLESIGYTFEGAEASVHLMILHSQAGYCPPFRVLDYSAQVFDTQLDSASRVLLAGQRQRQGLDEKEGNPCNGVGRATTARATVKVRTLNAGDEDFQKGNAPLQFVDRLEVSDGNGPVDALAHALKRALAPAHPSLHTLELVDYKVRILDPESATAAATRVMIEFRNALMPDTSWTTVSVDRNVISASLNALIDGFEYAIIEHADSCMLCEEEDWSTTTVV